MIFSKRQPDVPRRRQSARQDVSREASPANRYSFRRNRTLTGSASAAVGSASESSGQLKSSRVQAHELVRHRRRLGLVLVIIISLCAACYGLLWQFTAGIVVQSTGTAAPLEKNAYEEAIESYYNAHPIERLRFLADNQALSEYVQAKRPEVATVDVQGSAGMGKTVFMLAMRRPIAGWSINDQQQYVDQTGTAFTRNYFAAPAVQIVDNSGVRIEAGQAVTSNRFLSFVGRTVGIAKAQGYVVQQVVISAGKTREVELRLEGITYPIKLSIDRGVGEQIEDMSRSIKWLQAQRRTPDYLDVRISGKAFYR